MNKHYIILLLCAIIAPLCLMSCSETEDDNTEFSDWQNRNDTYFSDKFNKAIANTTDDLDTIRNYSYNDSVVLSRNGYIVVEKLEKGTGSGCPMFTDSVLINLRGRLIPSASYPDGYVFYESYTGDYDVKTAKPEQWYVGGLVDGVTTALQYMHIGDHWRVYIPYPLGYGTTAQTSIPAYSTLVFDVALMAYYRAGVKPGTYYAKQGAWVKE